MWRRLIDRKVAVERPYRWPRRGSSFELTNPLPTEWAGHFLRALISDRTEIPAAAATLWHALRALRLDDSYLELPPPIRQHLVEHAAIPADLASLFQALERCLVHRSTQL